MFIFVRLISPGKTWHTPAARLFSPCEQNTGPADRSMVRARPDKAAEPVHDLHGSCHTQTGHGAYWLLTASVPLFPSRLLRSILTLCGNRC